MHFLILSILASVSVAALLKVARQRGLSIEQMVATNYLVAIVLTVIFMQPQISNVSVSGSQMALFGALGILLPTVFIAMGRAVASAGIVKSDAAQRLSLFLPVLAAFTLFGEAVLTHRVVGLVLAILALGCLLYKPQNHATQNQPHAGKWLIAVWLGYGVIDILLKQLSKQGSALPLTLLVSFVLAGVLMFAYLFSRKTIWHKNNMLAGVILGALNFMNILFYLKAHQAFKESPTLVFAGMNMGVIVLGTLVGAIAFREKISQYNMIGVILALCAIVVLYFGQHFFAA